MSPEILNVRPEEAVRDFRAKGLHAGFHWRDTDAAQHLLSFTAAKAMRLDVLQALRDGVDGAIADGSTLATFRKDLEPKLRAMGWWGRQPMVDPATGKTRLVQLGSPHRLRTIFDTNLRMAYARGHWERIERLAEVRPYLRYVAVLDARTRPEHMAWHGTVLPWDHPFWKTHYPPCGWYCRCTVIQLSAGDVEEFGWQVSDAPPSGWDTMRPWRDRRTGRTFQVPVGIDPGFEHNAGLINVGKNAADRLVAKIDAAAGDLVRRGVGEPWKTALFRRHVTGATAGEIPIASVPPAVLGAIGGLSPTARLSSATAAKQTERHPEIDAADYRLAQRILDEGEIFAGRSGRLIGFIETDALWRAVFKVTKDGRETYLASLHRARPGQLSAARRNLEAVDRDDG